MIAKFKNSKKGISVKLKIIALMIIGIVSISPVMQSGRIFEEEWKKLQNQGDKYRYLEDNNRPAAQISFMRALLEYEVTEENVPTIITEIVREGMFIEGWDSFVMEISEILEGMLNGGEFPNTAHIRSFGSTWQKWKEWQDQDQILFTFKYNKENFNTVRVLLWLLEATLLGPIVLEDNFNFNFIIQYIEKNIVVLARFHDKRTDESMSDKGIAIESLSFLESMFVDAHKVDGKPLEARWDESPLFAKQRQFLRTHFAVTYVGLEDEDFKIKTRDKNLKNLIAAHSSNHSPEESISYMREAGLATGLTAAALAAVEAVAHIPRLPGHEFMKKHEKKILVGATTFFVAWLVYRNR